MFWNRDNIAKGASDSGSNEMKAWMACLAAMPEQIKLLIHSLSFWTFLKFRERLSGDRAI